MPTKFTRRAGLLALIAGAAWIAAGFLIAVMDGQDWQLYYALFSLAVIAGGILTVVAMVGLGRRVGGLGVLGMVGIIIAAAGVLLSFVSWAVPVWMGLEGVGLLLVGIAVLRSGTPVPTVSVVLVSSAFLAGPIVFFVVDALELGWRDSYGDYPLAWITCTAVAVVLMSAGLLGLGRWLRGETPSEVEPGALVA